MGRRGSERGRNNRKVSPLSARPNNRFGTRSAQASVIAVMFLVLVFVADLGFMLYLSELHQLVYQEFTLHEEVVTLVAKESLCAYRPAFDQSELLVTNTGAEPSLILAILEMQKDAGRTPPPAAIIPENLTLQPGTSSTFAVNPNLTVYVVTSYGNTFVPVGNMTLCADS